MDSILIKNEAAPNVGAEIKDVNCFGEENGWISLEIESESYPLEILLVKWRRAIAKLSNLEAAKLYRHGD